MIDYFCITPVFRYCPNSVVFTAFEKNELLVSVNGRLTQFKYAQLESYKLAVRFAEFLYPFFKKRYSDNFIEFNVHKWTSHPNNKLLLSICRDSDTVKRKIKSKK